MEVDYSKYYTPMRVASSLVNLLGFPDNSSLIDICCGSCNLISAAKQINNTLECIGVDVNPVLRNDYKIIQCDGRRYALTHKGQFDFALANPPFGKNLDIEYNDSLFVDEYKGIISSRIEIQMLVANLLLLKDDGVLLIILPSTIVDGESAINIRRKIAMKHCIKAIVDMPINSFAPKRIKCSALIIGKKSNINKSPTVFYSMNREFEIFEKYTLEENLISKGQWHRCEPGYNDCFTVVQGKVHSNEFSESGNEVLHTSKASKKWEPSVRYTKLSTKSSKLLKVESGDIIISRVGASAGQKMEYIGDSKLVSDCLLVIKKPSEDVKMKILDMDLSTIVRGLSTPYITARGIKELYGIIYDMK